MKQYRRIKISDKDCELLKMFCIFGFLSSFDIAKDFHQRTERNTRKHLNKFCDAGYLIKKWRNEGAVKSQVYTPNLYRLMTVVDKFTLDRALVTIKTKPWRRDNWRHENDVRTWAIRIFGLYNNAEIEPDYILLNEQHVTGQYALQAYKQLPDLVVRLPLRTSVAVEIEKSLKTISRYHQRFLDIMSEPNRPTLYLVEREDVRAAVQTGLQSAIDSLGIRGEKPQSKITLCLYQEAKDSAVLKRILDDLFGPERRPHFRPLDSQLGA